MPILGVVGAGGHGRVVAEAASLAGWDVIFFDDRAPDGLGDWPIKGSVQRLLDDPGQVDGAIVAIGNNRFRLDLVKRLLSAGIEMPAIVHPAAIVSPRAEIASAVFLAAGSSVGIGARVGIAAIINTGANVDHDCDLADGVHLSPGVILSGAVTIGECSWIGTGSSVRNNIYIGADVVIGVGSAVVANIDDGLVAYGVPARAVKKDTE